MKNKAVSDTGPIIHLHEIELEFILDLFDVIIPIEVHSELKKYKINSNIKIKKTINKNLTKLIMDKFLIDIGEASAINLALQEKINLVFTDDLEARDTAKKYGLDPHGTIGLIIKAFRKKIISKETAIKKIKELEKRSSLFITKDLINKIIDELKNFN